MSKDRILVFPKGTIVKFDGIPCELLQDTPYESEHFSNATLRKEDSVKKNDVKTSFFKKLFCNHENKQFVRGLDGDIENTTIKEQALEILKSLSKIEGALIAQQSVSDVLDLLAEPTKILTDKLCEE